MISIGILSYKRTDLLIETLKDIIQTKHPISLIILNNNVDLCILKDIEIILNRNNLVKLTYIHHNKNYGVAIGRRVLIEHCDTKHMILLDDDVEIPDINKIIHNVVACFHKNKDIKGIAFNIKEYGINKHNKYEIPHKNKKINMNEDFYTYLMIGAGHAVDVEVVRSIGNYPDDFGLYGFEEIDVAFRIINANYKIKYLCDCVVLHKKSPDGRFSNEKVNELAFINRTKMAKRYFSKKYFYSCLIVRSVFFLIKTKNIKLFLSLIKEIKDDKKTNKFGSQFYKYIKSVNGFIYW
ncbi:glycosyltransferase [Proteus mirabilis]|uniref:glycosyltransferase family 2 protein n=1 Tax=Proteus mirabilis TaxID=584 RepID=UPI001581A035|nr:glycosyltransferase [Proteus mirabilis]EKX4458055.1 glycosyltransferase family 2 protein [Proteus mirabilis]EKX4632926.1 glycosyltransferase family 2 protein [Proteus mirabilis]ELB4967003.1 glycosyltransferase family 2 protein [Proteus mirabilis]MCY9777424.1 glycosyltransferase [Proteus mirabilis]MCY9780957.1 glycosyltransferase [Proteus mirabilis]